MNEAPLNLSQRPRRKPGYRLEALDGELLLYHLGETRVLYLNESASLVWRLCTGEQSVAEIIELLSAAFPEAAVRLQDDVTAAIAQFFKAGCVEQA